MSVLSLEEQAAWVYTPQPEAGIWNGVERKRKSQQAQALAVWPEGIAEVGLRMSQLRMSTQDWSFVHTEQPMHGLAAKESTSLCCPCPALTGDLPDSLGDETGYHQAKPVLMSLASGTTRSAPILCSSASRWHVVRLN